MTNKMKNLILLMFIGILSLLSLIFYFTIQEVKNDYIMKRNLNIANKYVSEIQSYQFKLKTFNDEELDSLYKDISKKEYELDLNWKYYITQENHYKEKMYNEYIEILKNIRFINLLIRSELNKRQFDNVKSKLKHIYVE